MAPSRIFQGGGQGGAFASCNRFTTPSPQLGIGLIFLPLPPPPPPLNFAIRCWSPLVQKREVNTEQGYVLLVPCWYTYIPNKASHVWVIVCVVCAVAGVFHILVTV